MLKIAITGVIGSGKSTIAKIFKDMGYDVLDADEVSRDLTKKGTSVYREIIRVFGEKILKKDGQIDRRLLAEIVFNDREKKKLLEDIIHPEVKKFFSEKAEKLEREGKEAVIFDIPLLFEAGMENLVDYVILAYADKETLYERVKKRDGITKEEFLSRLKNQIPLEEKVKKSDFVIDTRKDIKELKSDLEEILKKVL
ncbi:MAG: dephospho-CoA kinase [Proteobacteria bacterium]|nr:dephospho-CoA kinase [Pseudomonadota bacterium]